MTEALGDARFRRGLLRAVAAPIVAMVVLGAALLWQIVALRSAIEEANLLTSSLRSARITYRLLIEMNLAVRRYQLTGASEPQRDYQRAQAELDRSFRDLQRFAEIDPLPPEPLYRLREARIQLTREATQVFDLGPPRDPRPAGADRLDPTLHEINRAFIAIIAEREQLRDERARHAVESTQRVMWSAGLLSLALGGLLAALVRRQIVNSVGEYGRAVREAEQRASELAEKEAELLAMAGSLERRVADRTRLLEEANRDLEAFSYSVSHDLRAPLRSLQAMAEALLEECKPALSPACADYARRICLSAEHLQALMDDLLRYGRLSRAEIDLAPTSLRKAIDEAIAQQRADLDARGAAVTVSDPLPDVRASWTILVQILANLISNAAKFVEGKPPEVLLRAERRGPRVRLWVEDNGIGIAPADQARIFRPFERLHGEESYPGTGIGLAIVQRGVERLGGAVGLEPGPGGGTRFWIDLDAAGEPA